MLFESIILEYLLSPSRKIQQNWYTSNRQWWRLMQLWILTQLQTQITCVNRFNLSDLKNFIPTVVMYAATLVLSNESLQAFSIVAYRCLRYAITKCHLHWSHSKPWLVIGRNFWTRAQDFPKIGQWYEGAKASLLACQDTNYLRYYEPM